MPTDPKPKPCPACGYDAVVNLTSHYTEGWRAQVYCLDYDCGLEGPVAHDKGPSNNEHKIEAQAIKLWNSISLST